MYYVTIHSHLAYLYLVWDQAKYSLNIITMIQKTAFRILHSAAYRDHACPLFHRYKVLKCIDLASLESRIFVNKCLIMILLPQLQVVIPIAKDQPVMV